MIREYWELGSAKVDAMALRERVMVFAAAAFLIVLLINTWLFEPLFARHKKLSAQITQFQEKIRLDQAGIEALVQAREDDARSPLRDRIRQLRQQISAGETYLNSRRDKLVLPQQMGELLEQILNKNGRVQLVTLDTLAVTPLVETGPAQSAVAKTDSQERQIYKHGVRIVLRGSYADLLQYLEAVEQMKTRMLWGAVKMEVLQHPEVELTLTLYTLSLEATWLQV